MASPEIKGPLNSKQNRARSRSHEVARAKLKKFIQAIDMRRFSLKQVKIKSCVLCAGHIGLTDTERTGCLIFLFSYVFLAHQLSFDCYHLSSHFFLQIISKLLSWFLLVYVCGQASSLFHCC